MSVHEAGFKPVPIVVPIDSLEHILIRALNRHIHPAIGRRWLLRRELAGLRSEYNQLRGLSQWTGEHHMEDLERWYDDRAMALRERMCELREALR